MTVFLEVVVSVLLVFGAIIMLIGSIGLAKFPDYFTRLHAPTKASTLGVACILIASMIFFSVQLGHVNLKEADSTQNQHLAKKAYLQQQPEDK